MYEKYLIRTDGFSNFIEKGVVAGFEMLIRIAYYRGIALTIINNIEVFIDGQSFPRESVRIGVNNRFYSFAELAAEEQVRWEFTEAVRVRVYLSGGLSAGAHDIQVKETIKPAYIPGNGF